MFHETLCLPTRKVEHKINFIFFSGLEQRFYQTDLDCISAGKPLPEFDLYISTVLPLENKGIRYGKTLFIVYLVDKYYKQVTQTGNGILVMRPPLYAMYNS